MREIHTERKITFAIVSIIFLSGIFFGLNFTNTSNDFLIKTPQLNEDGNNVDILPIENKQGVNLLQNYNSEEKKSMAELTALALEKINIDRLEHGLNPVKLGNNQAAQAHVEDMMNFGYFSHWDSNGVKPYVTYTKLDGRAYVKENIAASWCEGFTCKMNPAELIEKFQYLMVYDDAESNWGHRDNILDPNHSLVNIGITWNDNNFYFAQHFETKLIDLKNVEFSEDKVLRISGKLPSGYSLKSITVFQDEPPLPLSGEDLESSSPYNQNFYNSGTIAGILVTEPQLFEFYDECQKNKISISSNNQELCLPYATFGKLNDDNTFEIEVDLSEFVSEFGIHTIYVNLQNQKGDRVTATSITLEYL
ncbi:MAG: CAP domain-containing protein [Nitrosopumilus sp.]|nr:CAP domain-containing protein [Nitrosopumilus sp.]